MTTLPATGFVRLSAIIGDRRRGKPGPFPVSRSTWWKGVSDGRFPAPVRLTERTTAWRVEDIRALIERTGLIKE